MCNYIYLLFSIVHSQCHSDGAVCIIIRYINGLNIKRNSIKKEVEERLEMLDTILMDKFDVSFGNRIVTQTINFAAVFVAAGGELKDALDYQISTKILRKVISSDDEEALMELHDAMEEYPATIKLIEKRIKELR